MTNSASMSNPPSTPTTTIRTTTTHPISWRPSPRRIQWSSTWQVCKVTTLSLWGAAPQRVWRLCTRPQCIRTMRRCTTRRRHRTATCLRPPRTRHHTVLLCPWRRLDTGCMVPYQAWSKHGHRANMRPVQARPRPLRAPPRRLPRPRLLRRRRPLVGILVHLTKTLSQCSTTKTADVDPTTQRSVSTRTPTPRRMPWPMRTPPRLRTWRTLQHRTTPLCTPAGTPRHRCMATCTDLGLHQGTLHPCLRGQATEMEASAAAARKGTIAIATRQL